MLVGLTLIALIGLPNLILDLLVELLNLLHPFASLGAQPFLERKWRKVAWAKWIIAINNLERGLLGGAIGRTVVSELRMG